MQVPTQKISPPKHKIQNTTSKRLNLHFGPISDLQPLDLGITLTAPDRGTRLICDLSRSQSRCGLLTATWHTLTLHARSTHTESRTISLPASQHSVIRCFLYFPGLRLRRLAHTIAGSRPHLASRQYLGSVEGGWGRGHARGKLFQRAAAQTAAWTRPDLQCTRVLAVQYRPPRKGRESTSGLVLTGATTYNVIMTMLLCAGVSLPHTWHRRSGPAR